MGGRLITGAWQIWSSQNRRGSRKLPWLVCRGANPEVVGCRGTPLVQCSVTETCWIRESPGLDSWTSSMVQLGATSKCLLQESSPWQGVRLRASKDCFGQSSNLGEGSFSLTPFPLADHLESWSPNMRVKGFG